MHVYNMLNGGAHVFTVSSQLTQTHSLCSLSVSNPGAFSIYRHAACKKTHCGNLALRSHYSNMNTYTNTQLTDSNQQSNIRSEDILSSTHTMLKCPFTLEQGEITCQRAEEYCMYCDNIKVDKSCLCFSLSCIKMTHYCLNPARQHDEAINCAAYRLISLLKVLFALGLPRDLGVGV